MYVLYFKFIVFYVFSGIAKNKNPSRSEYSRLVGIFFNPLLCTKIYMRRFFLPFCNMQFTFKCTPQPTQWSKERERMKIWRWWWWIFCFCCCVSGRLGVIEWSIIELITVFWEFKIARGIHKISSFWCKVKSQVEYFLDNFTYKTQEQALDHHLTLKLHPY